MVGPLYGRTITVWLLIVKGNVNNFFGLPRQEASKAGGDFPPSFSKVQDSAFDHHGSRILGLAAHLSDSP
jgi:hypothetical protein